MSLFLELTTGEVLYFVGSVVVSMSRRRDSLWQSFKSRVGIEQLRLGEFAICCNACVGDAATYIVPGACWTLAWWNCRLPY